jgi:predicted lysophospholipase L1 biosynthesis ABC-type transport system permease subunit
MLYRHTQHSVFIVSVCLAAAALNAFLIWLSGQWLPAGIVLVVLVAVAIVFSSLTVEVGENELRWSFGPGFWTYRLPLGDIETVAIVRIAGGTASGSECAPASGSITCRASMPSNCS